MPMDSILECLHSSQKRLFASWVSDEWVGVITSSMYFQYTPLSFFWTRCLIFRYRGVLLGVSFVPLLYKALYLETKWSPLCRPQQLLLEWTWIYSCWTRFAPYHEGQGLSWHLRTAVNMDRNRPMTTYRGDLLDPLKKAYVFYLVR